MDETLLSSYSAHVYLGVSSVPGKGDGVAEVISDGEKLVGITVRESRDRLMVLPSIFIESILKARKEGKYRGLGYFPFKWQPAKNPVTHQFLKRTDDARGIIITQIYDVMKEICPLLPRDILLEIDGFPLDNRGYYKDPQYGWLLFEDFATRRKRAGDSLQLKVWREGQIQEISYVLPSVDTAIQMVPEAIDNQEPEYFVAGGLVFQPLILPYLRAWGADWISQAPFQLYFYRFKEPTKEQSSVVVLSQVLPDAYNMGYQDYHHLVVSKVNGKNIQRIQEITEAFKEPMGGFHIIEFTKGKDVQRLVLDAAELENATQRVLKNYGIEKDYLFQPAKPKQGS